MKFHHLSAFFPTWIIPPCGSYQKNYWVEDDPKQNKKFVTLVCVTSESYDDKNDKTNTKQSIYLRENCPYGWGTLVKSGAKYMVIEKAQK